MKIVKIAEKLLSSVSISSYSRYSFVVSSVFAASQPDLSFIILKKKQNEEKAFRRMTRSNTKNLFRIYIPVRINACLQQGCLYLWLKL